MDNVTHTLAGLLLAEGALALRRGRTGREPSGRLRTVAAVVGAVGANLPDADVLYTTAVGDPLAYLLHHRATRTRCRSRRSAPCSSGRSVRGRSPPAAGRGG
jgi:hypothetical protein